LDSALANAGVVMPKAAAKTIYLQVIRNFDVKTILCPSPFTLFSHSRSVIVHEYHAPINANQ